MKKLAFLVLIGVMLMAACTPAGSQGEMPVIETGVDPDRWATIPAGEFLQGQHDHEILVDYDYQIMVTDVTNAQYAKFLNDSLLDGTNKLEGDPPAGAHPVGYYPGDVFHGYNHEEEISEGWYQLIALDEPRARILFEDGAFSPLAGFENHPVVMVSWFGARAYCAYNGWRLPSEIEWEKAARGESDNRPFPWGHTLEAKNANYYSSQDIFEKTFGKQGSTTPVGFYNGEVYEGFTTLDSPSPYGLYDMAGNVWQWTGDVYDYQHYRYMRGGSKDTYGYNLRVWTRNSAGPEYYSPAVGFRCAQD